MEVFTVWKKKIPFWKLFYVMLLIFDFIINSSLHPKLTIMCGCWLRISIINNIGLGSFWMKYSNQKELKNNSLNIYKYPFLCTCSIQKDSKLVNLNSKCPILISYYGIFVKNLGPGSDFTGSRLFSITLLTPWPSSSVYITKAHFFN